MAYNPNILQHALQARHLTPTQLSRRLGMELGEFTRQLRREPEPKQDLLRSVARELSLPPFAFYMQQLPGLEGTPGLSKFDTHPNCQDPRYFRSDQVSRGHPKNPKRARWFSCNQSSEIHRYYRRRDRSLRTQRPSTFQHQLGGSTRGQGCPRVLCHGPEENRRQEYHGPYRIAFLGGWQRLLPRTPYASGHTRKHAPADPSAETVHPLPRTCSCSHGPDRHFRSLRPKEWHRATLQSLRRRLLGS